MTKWCRAAINRRQFEACVCRQLVQELKSADICVPGSAAYSDIRGQLLSVEQCAKALGEYGGILGLPVESQAFCSHLRAQLAGAADTVDRGYPGNPYFTIVDGRPSLARPARKPEPAGFQAVDDAVTRKLQALDLSLLDVLGDTMQSKPSADPLGKWISF